MTITDIERETLCVVEMGRVVRSTNYFGDGSYERTDGKDVDWDVLGHLARLRLIAWASPGVGRSSRELVELTAAGREAIRSL